MKYIKSLFIFLFLISAVNISFSQTADEVINKYVNAIGGMDKINSIKTVKITGKITGGMDIPFTQIVKRPGSMYMEMTIQGMTMKQGYDGTTAWAINPFQGNTKAEKLPPEQAKYMRLQAEIEGQIVNYKDKGNTVEYMGKEDVEGSDTYKLKLTDKDGDITYYYIDAASNLLIKESAKRKIKEKEISSDVMYGDYRPVDGFLIPFSTEVKSSAGQMGNQNITIEKAELNTPVEDEIFKMPEAK